MAPQRICSSCVLPGTPRLSLDEQGVCALCRSPRRLQHIRKESDRAGLDRLVEQARRRGRGAPHDCVVAWSGGRDSTFMLHELVVAHRLRCVAVFGRTPFTPPETVASVRAIAARLGVELVQLDTPPNHAAVAGYCVRQYLRTRAPILINLACAPCKFVNRELFRQAARLGVRTIVYGGNRFEYFPAGPASVDIDAEDRYSPANMLRDSALRLARGCAVLISCPPLVRHLPTLFAASVLYVNQYTPFLRLRYPGIVRFDYFHYADWDEARIAAVLRELGWTLPAGCTSSWRADCVFEAVKNAVFSEQVGFSYLQALYSNLIRAGKLTRAEALQRLAVEGVSEPRLRTALRLCGLPEDAIAVRP